MNYLAHSTAGEALFAISSFSEGEEWLRHLEPKMEGFGIE